ncbi:MAG: TIGR00730 family Rossman fold protein [Pseudomonadota bacterium]
MGDLTSLCVYCGSSAGDDPKYLDAAVELGRACAAQNVRLVYGGGNIGLMGACADAARSAGGPVLGIIPDFLLQKEGLLDGIENIIVTTMHERKQILFESADAFCVLPGGIGTMDEFIETASWIRLGLHHKPIVLANIGGYWSPMQLLLSHAIDHGFLERSFSTSYRFVDDVSTVITEARNMLQTSLERRDNQDNI